MNRFQDNRNQLPWQPHPKNGWELSQFKHYYNITLGKMLQNDSVTSLDIEVPYLKAQHVQWDRVLFDELPTMWASPHDIETLQIKKGDLLVCEGGEVGRAAIVNVEPPINCIIQNAIHLVHPKLKGEVRFLKYLLQNATTNKWLDVLCNRATIAHFTVEKFSQMRAWFPLLSEQKNIADYLDHETAYIDTLINAKLRFIGLLEEKRQALISHVVTRGLNSKVPMRSTRITWLGVIPTHWQVVPLKRIVKTKITDGPHETPDYDPEGVPFVSAEAVQNGHINFDSRWGNIPPELQKKYSQKLLPQRNDIFIVKSGATTGKLAYVDVDFEFNVWSPLALIRADEKKISSTYLFIVLHANYVQRQVRATWSAGTQPNISMGAIEELNIITPPLKEQQAIVDFLDREIGKLDKLSEATQSSITLLSERRAALISAAVTGQIEIPEASCN